MSDISVRRLFQSFLERPYRVDGRVAALLPGCGIATIDTGGLEEMSVDRTTDGLQFDQLRVGQRISCQVGPNRRVVRAQVDEPMQLLSETALMTKDEFAADYCRRTGVTWDEISKYRRVMPSSDGIGWEMANARVLDDAPTAHGALESL